MNCLEIDATWKIDDGRDRRVVLEVRHAVAILEHHRSASPDANGAPGAVRVGPCGEHAVDGDPDAISKGLLGKRGLEGRKVVCEKQRLGRQVGGERGEAAERAKPCIAISLSASRFETALESDAQGKSLSPAVEHR